MPKVSQCTAFMESDMLGLIAFDLVLWIVRASVVGVAFIIHVFRMHADDVTGDPARFRIPAYVIADFERSSHGTIRTATA